MENRITRTLSGRALALLCFMLCGSLTVSSVSAANPHNVLFIIVDDLRPELACYPLSAQAQ